MVTKEQFLAEFAEFVSCDRSDISEDSPLETLNWDSLAVLSLIGYAEEEFGIELLADDLVECKAISDVLNLLAGHVQD